jgi:plasmid stabilization system protein ParE
MQGPPVKLKSRAKRDFTACLQFIEQQPWGDAAARERDILEAMERIREAPEWRRIEIVRHRGVGLRRHPAAQFVIIYAYFKPKKGLAQGLVSIRAIRHRRVKNVFLGVRSPPPPPSQYGSRYQV